MIEVKKNEKESAASLIRRFTRKMQQSGNLMRVRQLRFKLRSQSELKKKETAIKRSKKKRRLEYMRKLGKIE